MRKLCLILLVCLLLGGCREVAFGVGELPLTEYKNELSNRRFLILTKQSAYSLAFIEQFWQKTQQAYSVTADDLNNILNHNFAVYNGVLIIERLNGRSAPMLDRYLGIYSGANNIVLHALDGEYSGYPISVVTANSNELDTEIMWDNVDRVFAVLREK